MSGLHQRLRGGEGLERRGSGVGRDHPGRGAPPPLGPGAAPPPPSRSAGWGPGVPSTGRAARQPRDSARERRLPPDRAGTASASPLEPSAGARHAGAARPAAPGWVAPAAGVGVGRPRGPPRGAGSARGGRGGGGAPGGAGPRRQCPEPGSGAVVAAAERGCLERAPGRRRVNGPPGLRRAGTDPPWDPRPRPPSLLGPVRPPAPRARAAPAPCAPLSGPSHDPGPSSYSLGRSSSPWGRIPGEGALIPWNSGPITRAENQPKFLLNHIVKVGKHTTQDLPARASCSPLGGCSLSMCAPGTPFSPGVGDGDAGRDAGGCP